METRDLRVSWLCCYNIHYSYSMQRDFLAFNWDWRLLCSSRKTGWVTVTVTCFSLPGKPVSVLVKSFFSKPRRHLSGCIWIIFFCRCGSHSITLHKANSLIFDSTYQRFDCKYRTSCGLRLYKGEREDLCPSCKAGLVTAAFCNNPDLLLLPFDSCFDLLSDKWDSCDLFLMCPKQWDGN